MSEDFPANKLEKKEFITVNHHDRYDDWSCASSSDDSEDDKKIIERKTPTSNSNENEKQISVSTNLTVNTNENRLSLCSKHDERKNV